MKKKLFCVIACLFMSSIGLIYSSASYVTSCGKQIITVDFSYFYPSGAPLNTSAYWTAAQEYRDYLLSLDAYYCAEEQEAPDEVYYDPIAVEEID